MADSEIATDNLVKKIEQQRNRNRALFKCAANWIEVVESGADIAEYFKRRKYGSVAIYGAGDLGRLLSIALRKTDINVEYFIDQSAEANRCKNGINVYLPEELKQLKMADVVVVTPIFYYKEIAHTLLKVRMDIPIVSLDSILDECLGELWYGEHCK